MELSRDCVDVKKDELMNATIHVGDQGNVNFLKKVILDSKGDFDIIIDDGSHIIKHQLLAFQWLYRHGVKPGGLFVMEDLNTSGENSRWSREGREEGDPSTADVFTDYAHSLMAFETETLPAELDWTRQMSCGVGMCVFQKWSEFDLQQNHTASKFFAQRQPLPFDLEQLSFSK